MVQKPPCLLENNAVGPWKERWRNLRFSCPTEACIAWWFCRAHHSWAAKPQKRANHCPHLVLFAHPTKTAMLPKLAPPRRLPTSKVFLFYVTVSCLCWSVNHLQCSKISEGSSWHQQLLRSPLFNDFTIMKNNNDVSNMRYGHVTCWNNCCTTMTSLKCYVKKRTLKWFHSRKQYHVTFSTTCEIIKSVCIIKIVVEKSDSCWMYDHTLWCPLWSPFIYKLSSLTQLRCRKRERTSRGLKSFCVTRNSLSSQCKTRRSSSKRTALFVALWIFSVFDIR